MTRTLPLGGTDRGIDHRSDRSTDRRPGHEVPRAGADLLWRYTRDHWAAGAAGAALAKRTWQENIDTPWGHQLERISREVRDDLATFGEIRRRLDHPGGRARALLALAGERAARLKFNGRLRTYSPLSRVEETEALLAGVRAKQLLWSSLENALGPVVAGIELAPLQARADSQIATLTELHRWATTEAFQPATASPDQPATATAATAATATAPATTPTPPSTPIPEV